MVRSQDPSPDDSKREIARALQHQRQGQVQEAEQIYLALLEQEPESASLNYLLGYLYFTTGALDQSRDRLARSVQLDPQQGPPWNDLGNCLRDLGQVAEAIDAYREAISQAPDLAQAHCALAQLRDHSLPDAHEDELDSLQQAYQRSEPDSPARRDLAWGLARACEQRQEWARAFELLQEAHRDSPAGQAFDLAATGDYFARIRGAFTPELVQRLAGAGGDSELPVFVLGLPRSGTTLVEQILASHSRVFGAGELRLVGNLCRQLEQRSGASFGEAFAELQPAAVASLARGYEGAVRPLAPTAERIVDKLPANFLALGMLALIFPRARFVHCRRDPLATCWSIYSTRFAEPHGFADDLADLGGYYRAYREHMAHWDALFPGRIHHLDYESLVAQPEDRVRELLAYIGLEFEPGCLEFHTTERPVRTASAAQVRQPLYRDALARHQPFSEYLAPLRDALGDLL